MQGPPGRSQALDSPVAEVQQNVQEQGAAAGSSPQVNAVSLMSCRGTVITVFESEVQWGVYSWHVKGRRKPHEECASRMRRG